MLHLRTQQILLLKITLTHICPRQRQKSSFLTALRQTGPDRLQNAASLLDYGADINSIHEFRVHRPFGSGVVEVRLKVTGLFDAAQRGDYEIVQFLLSRGADVMAKNCTGTALWSSEFPTNQKETLRALDGMRTSKNPEIVRLAEELYGVETEEDFTIRRDAFDGLLGSTQVRPMGTTKLKLRKVKSVLPKSRTKQDQTKQDRSNTAEESTEKRYDLRSRNSALSNV